MLYRYLYLKIIRYYISNINNINDVLNLFYIIDNIKKYNNTDDNMNLIIDSLSKYPLTEIELQKISLLEQQFNNSKNIEGYIITVLWLSILYYIDTTFTKEKKKKEKNKLEEEIEIENDIKKELKREIKKNKNKNKNKNIEINPLTNISLLGVRYGSIYIKYIY